MRRVCAYDGLFVLPELSILCPTIFSNAFNFGFAVFDGFLKLLGDKQADLFFCKRHSGRSARRLHSRNNGRRHVLKDGDSVIVADSFICFNINV